jgi:MATE family multidrug resistance protein
MSSAIEPSLPDSRPLPRELRQLLPLAGPIIASQLGQVGMTTVDTIIVGALGAQALAAIGLGGAIHMVLLVLFSGVVFAMAPLVSQAHGAGDAERTDRLVMQGVWLAVLASLPVILASMAGTGISLALGQDPAVAALSGDYLRALAWGILPQFVFIAFRQYLEGISHVRLPMVITLAGLVLNAVLCYLLVYGVAGWIPALGAVGSGWATSIVRWMMCLTAFGCLLGRARQPFRPEYRRPDRHTIGTMVRLGMPIGIQTALEVGLFSLAAVMMGWISPMALAAHQVTINIASTTFMVALGMSQAGAIRVGQLIGAGKRHLLRHAVTATYLLAMGFMGLCALLFVSVPDLLVRLHTPDAAVIDLGSKLLLMAALFQLFDGAQVAGVAILRGAADTKVPMIVGAVGYWLIGLPAGYFLAFHTSMGPTGIWGGLCIGLAAVAVLLGMRVRNVLASSSASPS